ncbi:MAG: hypothetical protein AB8B96_22455 [Lysobacterales bacterium]
MLGLFLVVGLASSPTALLAQQNPILFVTQVPLTRDFGNIMSTFATHRATPDGARRGGDLWIRYPNGNLRNLTQEAGFGVDGYQENSQAIAVRDPEVHWSGNRALFSMVVGSSGQRRWQIYEINGLGENETAAITLVPGQPSEYNNVTPIYDSLDRIVFTSDRPWGGLAHLYPQLDEYESTPTNTGLHRLTPSDGSVVQLEDAPSGSFSPTIDSFGRIVFIRWDHLQRDQQNGGSFGAYNLTDESSGASQLGNADEVFPEPLAAGNGLMRLRVNHFTPWQLNQDGTGHLTVNHMGRHDFLSYFTNSFTNDNNLREFIGPGGNNRVEINSFFMIREDATAAGTYYAVDGPEFQTHSSGGIVKLVAPPGRDPENIETSYVTHPDTGSPGNGSNHSGMYRNPEPLSNGQLMVVHTDYSGTVENIGSTQNPRSPYDFELKILQSAGNGFMEAGPAINPPITKTVTWGNSNNPTTHTGPLWQLQPVEVLVKATPPFTQEPQLQQPEMSAIQNSGIDVKSIRSAMKSRNLALIVIRNATRRNQEDRQQPFNLSVPGGATTTGAGGTLYEVESLQIMQGDRIRGYNQRAGRRSLATPMHDEAALELNASREGSVPGSSRIASDGSIAMFVPAGKALSWQTVSPQGAPVVRERVWVNFAAGEIVMCEGCHGGGPTSINQDGLGAPANVPEALTDLIRAANSAGLFPLFNDGYEG